MGRTPTPNTVLVIKPVINAQKRTISYEAVEVAEFTAEQQFNLPDDKKNALWVGVRMADEREYNEYYGIQNNKESVKSVAPKLEETVESETVSTTNEPKTRGRKPKEVTNE